MSHIINPFLLKLFLVLEFRILYSCISFFKSVTVKATSLSICWNSNIQQHGLSARYQQVNYLILMMLVTFQIQVPTCFFCLVFFKQNVDIWSAMFSLFIFK